MFADHLIDEIGTVSLTDHVIDETSLPKQPRQTRAQQREATRQAIIDATVECLMQDGYGVLTTRRVAERAGIAQSTVMHHFETREALLVDAVTQVATSLAERALDTIDFAALRTPALRAAVLDEAWLEFSSPQALAAAQLWAAVWSEPELAPVLRELEGRVTLVIAQTAIALFPNEASDPRLFALIDAAVSIIRGLVFSIPIWGEQQIRARWEAIKPLMLEAASNTFGD